MTADATKEDREACINAGMNDYISKPIKFNDVVLALQRVTANVFTNPNTAKL
jgi:CheY-like chemotaxis protein